MPDNPEFPLIPEFDRYTIAFQDGWLNVRDGAFHKHEHAAGTEHGEDQRPVIMPPTDHFYDACYHQHRDAPTPHFDKLVKTQLLREEMCDGCFSRDLTNEEHQAFEWILALVGRTFVPPADDNWQITPFVKGPPGNGKSVFLNTVRKLHREGSVSELTGQSRRGLASLQHVLGKVLLMMPDMPSDFFEIVPEDTWTQLVDGHMANLSILYGPSKDVRIDFQMLAAGNELPRMRDVGGRATRRWAVINWCTRVCTKDNGLDRSINDELPAILLKSIAAYHAQRGAVGDGSVLEHIPELLLVPKDAVRAESDPVFKFLRDGSDHCCLRREEGAFVEVSKIREAYNHHTERVLRQPQLHWPSDPSSQLDALGLALKRLDVCRACGRKARKADCADHWNGGKNRKNVTCIIGLRICVEGSGGIVDGDGKPDHGPSAEPDQAATGSCSTPTPGRGQPAAGQRQCMGGPRATAVKRKTVTTDPDDSVPPKHPRHAPH
eukprot:m.268385 g.268385  ORF g.268385 m.268385 type:complete len:491 (-) comp11076_c1_seq1:1081-2553(-)